MFLFPQKSLQRNDQGLYTEKTKGEYLEQIMKHCKSRLSNHYKNVAFRFF